MLEPLPVVRDNPIALTCLPMAGNKIDFATVRKIGLTLPEVEESTAYGSPALKLRGKLLACIPTHRSAEPGSLVVCVSFEDRAELLAGAPNIYYLPEHYANHPSVLVRLSRITPDMLRDLLGMAHKLASAKTKSRPSRKRVSAKSKMTLNADR